MFFQFLSFALKNYYNQLFNSILALFWLTFPLGIHNLYTDFVFHLQWSPSSCVLTLTTNTSPFQHQVWKLTSLWSTNLMPIPDLVTFSTGLVSPSELFFFLQLLDHALFGCYSQSKSLDWFVCPYFCVISLKLQSILSLQLIWSLPLEVASSSMFRVSLAY